MAELTSPEMKNKKHDKNAYNNILAEKIENMKIPEEPPVFLTYTERDPWKLKSALKRLIKPGTNLQEYNDDVISTILWLSFNSVKQNGFTIKSVPLEFRTRKICEMAVNFCGVLVKKVPDTLITYEMCKISVEDNGFNIKIIMRKFPTFVTCELCEISVRSSGFLLKKVVKHNPEFVTEELCIEAINNNPFSLKNIPKELITQKMCDIAVDKCEYVLENVPETFITEEMCIGASKKNKYIGEFIPDRFKNIPEISENIGNSSDV